MGDKTGAVVAAKSYVQELLDAYYNYEDALNRADLGKTQKAGANAKLDSMWKAYLEAERAYKALAKKSRATDLEPIPVEDAMPERERRESIIRSFGALVQHQYKTPKPGSANLPCKECGLGVEAPERQRLHRALDAVMDAKAKDFKWKAKSDFKVGDRVKILYAYGAGKLAKVVETPRVASNNPQGALAKVELDDTGEKLWCSDDQLKKV